MHRLPGWQSHVGGLRRANPHPRIAARNAVFILRYIFDCDLHPPLLAQCLCARGKTTHCGMASLLAAARPRQGSLPSASQQSPLGRRQPRRPRGLTIPAAAPGQQGDGSTDQPRPSKPRKGAEHATPAIVFGTFLATEVGLLASGIKVGPAAQLPGRATDLRWPVGGTACLCMLVRLEAKDRCAAPHPLCYIHTSIPLFKRLCCCTWSPSASWLVVPNIVMA